MDYETARANMIEQQIRPWNVLEMQTLNALGAVRREDFVPEQYRDQAFTDVQIPLGGGAVMLEPKVSARLMEALHLSNSDKVLEIGTGSGYVTALLAQVCRHVTSVEIDPSLHTLAQRNLGMAGIENVELAVGDGVQGWDQGKPFDAIFVSGSVLTISPSVLDCLAPAGRLVVIEGQAPAMQAVLYENQDNGFQRTSLFETSVPRLKNIEEEEEFIF